MSLDELIHDWNNASGFDPFRGRTVMLDDETLRDGLQNPSVHDPTIGEKIEILHLMETLGIDSVNIGLPGAGPRALADTEALAREIARAKMKIRPNCAARTHENDIRPIAEVAQRAGIAIEAATFLGSSPIRRLVEDWTVDHLQRTTEPGRVHVAECVRPFPDPPRGEPRQQTTDDPLFSRRDVEGRGNGAAEIRCGGRRKFRPDQRPRLTGFVG